ncbi:hypothetical protein [Mesorhizobium sp.]|uniref:hypothetical protein n=1 Tax=Mesorhizobium sp. TaxID=1871066 RepID=UPI000FEA3B47|nr:hypothetical protein [Mesorhizobium sp.]RWF67351.1 MAG: hypothetical protein EOS47_02520 [Mesorhizobium sp.]TIT44549.1 MAG: hypothetical protein E5W76_01915 [Mesorhizobium sp.]
MFNNPYSGWLKSDNDLCKSVIPSEEVQAILREVGLRVFQVAGPGPKPVVALDLEHLQVADYAAFEKLTSRQRQQIAMLHTGSPIRPEEMVFLALKSLFQFVWPEPTSEDDIRYACYYHSALNDILVNRALDLASAFSSPEALLPYWGRLAFLRVMVDLPPDNISRFGLEGVACTLVKRPKLNATTIAIEGGSLICMNYALEPILKHLNTFLLHFHSTKDWSGPDRLSRAWEGIVPTVLHFWADIAVTRITRNPIPIYEEATAYLAHQMTADQLSFIVMHELGHVALDHPQRLSKEQATGYDVTVIRNEFEFAADAFALGLMRSRFIVRTRVAIGAAVEAEQLLVGPRVNSMLHVYQSQLGSVYLLFTYMDFVQRAGELLRHRLNGRTGINARMDTHPNAKQRLDRLELMNLGEYLYTSQLQRYATEFLQSVLDHAAALNDDALFASVAGSRE